MAYLLTCNAGSSSIKLSLFEADTLSKRASAAVENIGQAQPQFLTDYSTVPVDTFTHTAAARHLTQWVKTQLENDFLTSIGHRVVHGGGSFVEPTAINEQVKLQFESLKSLDPDHMPPILETLAVLQEAFPTVSHIACFDTAFFHDLPTNAKLTTLPRKYYEQGVRRYGFHGLSYEFIVQDFANHEGEQAAHGRVIMAHLGSGCSLAALKDKQPQETTMGFTPTSGLPMSTRSGDIDPGIAIYLAEHYGIDSPQALNSVVNHESGLLGVSDLSADMLTLLQNQETNQQAAEAVELFCYQVSKSIGALSVSIGGLTSLIFSGGIGERSSEIRQRICERLDFLGIRIDSHRNAHHERLISADESDVGVHVIRTDEAVSIARATTQVLKKGEN